jgi:uncharacterized protein
VDFLPPAPKPSPHRSRRLRKKLRIGEFKELGFAVTFAFHEDITNQDQNDFWDRLIDEVERQGLAFGGGTEGYITLMRRGTVTAAHWDAIREWLCASPVLARFELGALEDAYYAAPAPE